MEQFYTVSINGQKAVDAARMILGQYCTKIIKVGKASGQMEIVLDSDDVYNGYIQKWVDISYIDTREEADAIIAALPAMGFGGCAAVLLLETTHGSYSEQAEIGGMFTIPAEGKEPESGTASGEKMETKMEITVTRLNEGYDVGVMGEEWDTEELLSAVVALIQMGAQEYKKFTKDVKAFLRDFESGNRLPEYTIEIPGEEDESAE